MFVKSKLSNEQLLKIWLVLAFFIHVIFCSYVTGAQELGGHPGQRRAGLD